jgi:hypothetical protein
MKQDYGIPCDQVREANARGFYKNNFSIAVNHLIQMESLTMTCIKMKNTN